MDPSVRVLRQITLDDAAAADELFSILMGGTSGPPHASSHATPKTFDSLDV